MRNTICHADLRFLVLIATIATPLVVPPEASATAQFSRQFNTSCTTCHTAFPKLNDVGIAFKDAGFQFSDKGCIPDPNLRRLQQRYFKELNDVGTQVTALPFPDRFYLSPALDVDKRMQKHLEQRSLRFASFKGETVLEVTGNYYAVYPRERMDANKRASQTFEDVLLPILKVMVSQFPTENAGIQGYVLEVSHRVRGRVLGVSWPTTENVAVVLSQDAAEQLDGRVRVVTQSRSAYRRQEPADLRDLGTQCPSSRT